MIPKKIWQTYKDDYDSLPAYIKETTDTWKYHNPSYEYEYMNDEQARDFIKAEYGKKILNLFDSVPIGVMRGDMWRYLIIYKHGGIYADLDTVCNNPVESWLIDDKKFIICPENDIHLCQWTFAASPKHPCIESVINLMVERLSNNPDWTIPHFVHYYTGPAVWTDGIINYLGVEKNNKNIEDSLLWNELDRANKLGFYCYGGENWRMFHSMSVRHIYGSQAWHDGYEQWIKHPLTDSSRQEPIS